MISIVLALVLSQAVVPGLRGRVCHDELGEGSLCGWGYVQTPSVTVPSYAFFEFAPASGAGMGTACACTAVTGAKGEVLSVARASSVTCTKGSPTTGINDGDLVECGANLPAVMPGDSSGVLGVLTEPAGANDLLKSEQWDQPPWATAGTAITVTANYALSPKNTLTAERLQIPATSGGGLSLRYQSGLAGAQRAGSFYVKGTSGSGALDIYQGASSFSCGVCTFNQTTWTRCTITTSAIGLASLQIGNDSADCGGAARSAVDILVWGGQSEPGIDYVSSYMPTDAAGVTRPHSVIDAAVASSPTSGFSLAASFVPLDTTYNAGGSVVPIVLGGGTLGSTSAPSPYVWLYSPSVAGRVAHDTGGVVASGSSTYDPMYSSFSSTSIDVAAYHTGTSINVCQEGECAVGSASVFGAPTFTRILFGRYNATVSNHLPAVIKKVCYDPSSTRCAPSPQTGPIVWIGDSIVRGVGSLPLTPPKRLTTLSGRGVVNAGVPSQGASSCAARWTSTYKTAGYQTLVWSCAVNDLAAGTAGAAVAATVQGVLAEARALGMKVIVTQVMPWKNSTGWTAGKQTETNAYNAAMSTWASLNGATYISTTTLGQGGDPDILLAAYDVGDLIHPNAAGALAFATLVNASTP